MKIIIFVLTFFLAIAIASSALAVNKVLSLDGDGDYVDLGDSLVEELFSAITVEAWFQVNGIVSEQSDIFYNGTEGEVGLSYINENIYFGVKTEEDLQWHNPPPFPIEIGKWYHVAGVWSNAQVSLFVNGRLMGLANTEATLHQATGHLPTIGAYCNGLGEREKFFKGIIDEVRIWNSARTQEQIQETMNQPLENPELLENLVGYWNFDDGTADDLSQYGNDGTLQGDATIVEAERAKVIFVPGDYLTIQEGIDAASDGDIVLVADGTYKGTGNKNLDFGGKAITVTSENGAENCIIDCESEGRGFCFYKRESSDSILDGFTIKNGWSDKGGGISCTNSSPTIRNNIIIANFALDGGGIYCGNGSNAIISSNIISSNTADYWGGGISTPFSSPIITGNLIIGNVAALQGGGGQGGGIAAYGSSSPIISNNVIAQNSAVLNPDIDLEVGGGAISLDAYANAIIVNNTIVQNHTEYGFGGGIFCDFNASPIITNNIIVNSTKGAGIWVSSVGAHPVLSHNDVWNNADGEYAGISPGIGDISIDPIFVDAANRDYHLSNWSPCIGKGIMTDDIPITDKDGNPRPNPPGSNPDIGAYEHFRDVPLAVTLASLTALNTTDGITLKWRTATETNNLGFNVYRSDTKDGKYVKVNARLIAGAGSDATPHDYSFTDENVILGKTYYYYIEDIDFSGETNRSHIIEVTVGKQNIKTSVKPLKFALLQNFPNPFNPETWIPYQLAQPGDVTIRIYDISGKLVRSLELGNKPAGIYMSKKQAAYWNGCNDDGERVASGIYFYALQSGEFQSIRKMSVSR